MKSFRQRAVTYFEAAALPDHSRCDLVIGFGFVNHGLQGLLCPVDLAFNKAFGCPIGAGVFF
jgi:hypothetical protein